jgi:hypothetical protein
MANVTPCQIEPPFNFEIGFCFDLLSQKLAKHHLLGKILRSYHGMIRARRSASRKQN